MTTQYNLGEEVLVAMKVVSINIEDHGIFYDVKRAGFTNIETVSEAGIYGSARRNDVKVEAESSDSFHPFDEPIGEVQDAECPL